MAGLLTAGDIAEWLTARIAELAGIDRSAVDAKARISDYGLDSRTTIRLTAELGAVLDQDLPAMLLWTYPTIEAVTRHLTRPAADSVSALGAASDGAQNGAVAIVGMACRFPGAADPAAFWRLLVTNSDAITEGPAGRWQADAPLTRWGGFLDRVDRFDAAFFGIPAAEAAEMDPQQRLMLELSWEALHDAGIRPSGLRDSRTGVFFGAMWTDYARLTTGGTELTSAYSATGQDLSIIAARVSYQLGLRGPSLAVNTACSSSLVAVHLARQSLLSGESTLALAGGVNLLLSLDTMIAMCQLGAIAPDGRCKAFDARADGYVRGEGGAVVVLKPLSRALADGDRIHSVLLGSAVNNDGFSNGLTAPSPQAQEWVLRDACAAAGIRPARVEYVEAHGTGTMLGDPIEAGALGAVLGRDDTRDKPLLIGSAKTNIGHLEAAAGMAGLIKTTLALKHGLIPPSLHFERPNPHIAFEDLGLRVATELTPLSGPQAIAGVSAFGFGGTNAHVVLAAPPCEEHLPQPRGGRSRPVFVFGGQGSQWPGMGRELMREPAFRAVYERCDDLMRPYLGGSLLHQLVSDDPAWLADAARVQPAIFAVQVSLAALWRSLGVEPAAVAGTSMGEVAAAYVAGCLSLADAVRVICVRSRLVTRTERQGAMALIELPAGDVRTLLSGRAEIAVYSSPGSTVISGDVPVVEAAVAAAAAQGVFAQRVDVGYASHCAQMDPLLPDLARELHGIRPRAGDVPFWSTVSGTPLDGIVLVPAYWCRNLREPVLLAPVIQQLAADGHDVFLEVNPHALMARDIERCVHAAGRVLPSMRRAEPAYPVLRDTLTALGDGEPAITGPQLLLVSAHDQTVLRSYARELARWLRGPDRPGIVDVCYTAAVRRDHYDCRLAVIGSDAGELATALDDAAASDEAAALGDDIASPGGTLPHDGADRRAVLAAAARRYLAGHDLAWADLWPLGGRTVALPPYSWRQDRYWSSAAQSTAIPASTSARSGLLECGQLEHIADYLELRLSEVAGAGSTRDVPLQSLGLTSLKAMELRAMLLRDLHVDLPISCFLRAQSVSELAHYALSKLRESGSAELMAESRHHYQDLEI